MQYAVLFNRRTAPKYGNQQCKSNGSGNEHCCCEMIIFVFAQDAQFASKKILNTSNKQQLHMLGQLLIPSLIFTGIAYVSTGNRHKYYILHWLSFLLGVMTVFLVVLDMLLLLHIIPHDAMLLQSAQRVPAQVQHLCFTSITMIFLIGILAFVIGTAYSGNLGVEFANLSPNSFQDSALR